MFIQEFLLVNDSTGWVWRRFIELWRLLWCTGTGILEPGAAGLKVADTDIFLKISLAFWLNVRFLEAVNLSFSLIMSALFVFPESSVSLSLFTTFWEDLLLISFCSCLSWIIWWILDDLLVRHFSSHLEDFREDWLRVWLTAESRRRFEWLAGWTNREDFLAETKISCSASDEFFLDPRSCREEVFLVRSAVSLAAQDRQTHKSHW